MAANEKKKQADAALHKDHRKRVKEKFLKTGLDGFHEHNILEMLLFYAIPRCDTNEIAHRLINEFGSFRAVFEATVDELTNVDGIGIEAATLIRFIAELMKAYDMNCVKESKIKQITDSETAAKILRPMFRATNYEKFIVLFLNSKCGLISQAEYTQESHTSVSTDFVVILQKAVLLQAKGIIIAHNHPTGFAVPSQEDIMMTERLSNLCKPMGIIFCDHLIFSGKEYCCLSKIKGVKRGTCAF